MGLKRSKKGNLSSSFKKASDGVWRDLRQELTFIVDDNSLNPQSNKFFLEMFCQSTIVWLMDLH